jgi:hypothetical protein
MKTLRHLSVALVFVLALTVPALAGDIETGKPQQPPSNQTTATAEGQIETTVARQEQTGSGEATVADSATEIALILLQRVLSLFSAARPGPTRPKLPRGELGGPVFVYLFQLRATRRNSRECKEVRRGCAEGEIKPLIHLNQ